jgi:hypothetical protein
MRAFVEDYYADLPSDTTNAWKKVDAQWQNKTGHQDFWDFWATIQSVALVSVSPRDATSVVARVRYVPRDGEPSTEDRWLKMISANGQILLDGSGRIGSVDQPTTAAPATGSPTKAVDGALLTSSELSSLLSTKVTDNPAGNGGAGGLAMNSSSYGTSDHSSQVKPRSCVGVAFTGEHDVYGDADVKAIKTQSYNSFSEAGPDTLQQTAAVFSSADSAQKFLSSVQAGWNACANSDVDVTLGYENGRGFKSGSVRHKDDLVTISMADNGGMSGAHACQQALGIHANVIAEVRTCDVPPGISNPMVPADPHWATDDAERVVAAMLAKVKP